MNKGKNYKPRCRKCKQRLHNDNLISLERMFFYQKMAYCPKCGTGYLVETLARGVAPGR